MKGQRPKMEADQKKQDIQNNGPADSTQSQINMKMRSRLYGQTRDTERV